MHESHDIWTGIALSYDQVRPTPPVVLLDLLTQLLDLSHPALVVDVGSGTGLSTAIWGERADQVIGIEPNAEMRSWAVLKAQDHPYAAHITYRDGFANQTGLPDACADIVTAAQSFHWMEPTSTLAEIARILRSGGLFAAYDYDWPPVLNWELEQVYQEIDRRFDELLQERGLVETLQRWPKHAHLTRMRDSGSFRFTREFVLHHIEYGDAARFLEMVLTNAYSHHFKRETITEHDLGFDRLRHAAFQSLGSRPVPWYFSYRVRIGIR